MLPTRGVGNFHAARRDDDRCTFVNGIQFVTQLFPTLIASLLPRNPVTKEGAFAGICAGVVTVGATSLTPLTMATLLPGAPEAVRNLNIGIAALVLNLVSLGIVSAVTRRRAVGAFSA
jgi:solute:Na+ symporter, SSS family